MLHPDTRTLDRIQKKAKPTSSLEESGFWLLILAVVFVMFFLTPIGSKLGHDLKIAAANTYSTNGSRQTLVGDISQESKAYLAMLRAGNPITSLQHARQHAIDAGAGELGGQVNNVMDQVNAAGASPKK